MNIVKSGIVYSGQKGTDCQSCSFPWINVLPNGRWICVFRAAPSKAAMTGQRVLVTWSDDEGQSWSKPFDPFISPPVEGKPGLFHGAHLTVVDGHHLLAVLRWVDHSDPSLPLFNAQTQGLLDTRICFSKSADNGLTWSKPELMDTSPFNVPISITGPVLLLPNGDLACQFELNKHYYDTSVWCHSSVMMFSKDGGRTWPEHAITSRDPENRIFYWDQRPGILANGTILNLFMPYDTKTDLYLNIHARESRDNGRTWSAIWDTGVPGQASPPVSLPDGRVVMAYVDRTGVAVIKMRTTDDGGRTWPDNTGITICRAEGGPRTGKGDSMKDTWAEMFKFSIGLPQSTLLPNGDILVVYYSGPEADRTDVLWVRIQRDTRGRKRS